MTELSEMIPRGTDELLAEIAGARFDFSRRTNYGKRPDFCYSDSACVFSAKEGERRLNTFANKSQHLFVMCGKKVP